MTALSRRIKAAGIKDEWEFLLRLAGGEHSAAYMLRRCILWSNNPTVKKANGWFWRRDSDWRSADGLNRYKLLQARTALTKLGLLNTCVQRILLQTDLLLGKKMTHYQINPMIFWATVESTIEDMTGTVPATPENEKPESTESKNTPILREKECSPSSDGSADGEQIEVSKVATYGCEPSSDADDEGRHTKIPLNKTPEEKTPDSNLQIPAAESPTTAQDDDRHQGLDWIEKYADVFGVCYSPETAMSCIRELGAESARDVLERCKTSPKAQSEGVTWGYAIKCLKNEIRDRRKQQLPAITAIGQTPPPTPSPTIRSWAREHFNDVPEWFAAELAATT